MDGGEIAGANRHQPKLTKHAEENLLVGALTYSTSTCNQKTAGLQIDREDMDLNRGDNHGQTPLHYACR